MKHYKTNKTADTEMYEKLDYYDYSEFDDDYYYDMVEERSNNQSNRTRSYRKNSRYAHAFHDYIKDY
jgi:hypothetical protein